MMQTNQTGARVGLPEDLDHDPSYRRQRNLSRYILGVALNRLRCVGFFEPAMDADPKKVGADLMECAIEQGLVTFDDLHHAPACPANHFHHQRLPTGPCNCGAGR